MRASTRVMSSKRPSTWRRWLGTFTYALFLTIFRVSSYLFSFGENELFGRANAKGSFSGPAKWYVSLTASVRKGIAFASGPAQLPLVFGSSHRKWYVPLTTAIAHFVSGLAQPAPVLGSSSLGFEKLLGRVFNMFSFVFPCWIFYFLAWVCSFRFCFSCFYYLILCFSFYFSPF